MINGISVPRWPQIKAAFDQAPEVVQQELLRSVTEADLLLEREVKDATPTASGITRASIYSRVQALPMGAIGVVASTQPSVIYTELGTRPHGVNAVGRQALADWAKVKFGVSDKQAKSIAFLVARKIRERGTLGVGMFHRTLARLAPILSRILDGAADRIAARLAGNR